MLGQRSSNDIGVPIDMAEVHCELRDEQQFPFKLVAPSRRALNTLDARTQRFVISAHQESASLDHVAVVADAVKYS